MRWRLTQKHYLNVPGTEYEYKETSQATGRQVRKVFPVPRFLDPDDMSDCNHLDGFQKICVVAHANGAHLPQDIIFEGPPTLDMVPLDDEAKAYSAEMARGWGQQYSEDESGYTGKLLLELTDTLQAFNASNKGSGSAVPDDARLKALEDQIKMLADMNMALIAKLDPAGTARRV